MQRLVVQVQTRQNDALPQEHQPLIPFQSKNVGTLLILLVSFRNYSSVLLQWGYTHLTHQRDARLITGRPHYGGAADYDALPYAANAAAEVLVNAPHPFSSRFGGRRSRLTSLVAADSR